MKTCKKCERVLPESNFHKNARRLDGLECRCKACMMAYKMAHYRTPRAQATRAVYALKTSKERNLWAKGWRQRNHEKIMEIQRRYRERNRVKYLARTALRNAVRDGKVQPKNCEVCGKKAEAHHPDYSRPLEVRWLCKGHHEDVHRLSA